MLSEDDIMYRIDDILYLLDYVYCSVTVTSLRSQNQNEFQFSLDQQNRPSFEKYNILWVARKSCQCTVTVSNILEAIILLLTYSRTVPNYLKQRQGLWSQFSKARADPGFWNGGWIFVIMSEKSNNIISIFEGYETKKERRGLRKRGVKIHPFHLPWIRACKDTT